MLLLELALFLAEEAILERLELRHEGPFFVLALFSSCGCRGRCRLARPARLRSIQGLLELLLKFAHIAWIAPAGRYSSANLILAFALDHLMLPLVICVHLDEA